MGVSMRLGVATGAIGPRPERSMICASQRSGARMPNCARCGKSLDDKSRTVYRHELCEFCAVIAEANLSEFLEKLLAPDDEFEAWLEEESGEGDRGD